MEVYFGLHCLNDELKCFEIEHFALSHGFFRGLIKTPLMKKRYQPSHQGQVQTPCGPM
jgi:hypothetical protein